MRLGLLGTVYLVIGLIVAANENYLRSLDTIREVISALLAIALWPLILVGVDLRVRA